MARDVSALPILENVSVPGRRCIPSRGRPMVIPGPPVVFAHPIPRNRGTSAPLLPTPSEPHSGTIRWSRAIVPRSVSDCISPKLPGSGLPSIVHSISTRYFSTLHVSSISRSCCVPVSRLSRSRITGSSHVTTFPIVAFSRPPRTVLASVRDMLASARGMLESATLVFATLSSPIADATVSVRTLIVMCRSITSFIIQTVAIRHCVCQFRLGATFGYCFIPHRLFLSQLFLLFLFRLFLFLPSSSSLRFCAW
mmetsp:Transcript_17385/g.31192  ORF Transcript_17385/g.31192 Transcript_17385/m.31192 type:complete len:252 (-) Transcript_17385:848-1603(-)